MNDRFQLRRWPAGCPPLVGELAVIDSAHHERIVRTYRDEHCRARGGALKAAEEDIARWNVTPPQFVPIYVPYDIRVRQRADGVTYLEQIPNVSRNQLECWNEADRGSLCRDFRYVGLDAPGVTTA